MNTFAPYRLSHIASVAIVMLLTACGGGGGATGAAPSTPAAAATASPAPAATASLPAPPVESPTNAPAVVAVSDLSLPQAATSPALDPRDEMTGSYTLVPATAPTDTSGEPPYPDLRMMPTRVAPFKSVVVGDVSRVAVTDAG